VSRGVAFSGDSDGEGLPGSEAKEQANASSDNSACRRISDRGGRAAGASRQHQHKHVDKHQHEHIVGSVEFEQLVQLQLKLVGRR
jgi:hypothetical protein